MATAAATALAAASGNTAATGGTAATGAASGTAAKTAGAKLTGSFDTFLTLLTTQLKNQSPDDPLDTNQMTQQLVQFASVEQQIAMNGNLGQMIGLQQAAQLTASAPLLGRTVEVAGDQLSLQNGAAALRLPAAGAATRATVTVSDSAGRTLRSQEVRLDGERSTWTWDGRDAAGNKLPDGAYRVAVSGTNAAGAAQTLDWTVTGTATGAERRGGALKLMLGNAAYGFDQVRSVTSGG